MLDIYPKLLNEEDRSLIRNFSCVEADCDLQHIDSKARRRIKKRSREMDQFLKEEAIDEQTKNLNTTHLFLDANSGELVGFVSLCSDSIPLQLSERAAYHIKYQNVPAIKIARLATCQKYQHQGIAQYLISYAVYRALKMRDHCGVKFLTLDCYKHRVGFYEKQGFERNLTQSTEASYDAPISMRLHIDD